MNIIRKIKENNLSIFFFIKEVRTIYISSFLFLQLNNDRQKYIKKHNKNKSPGDDYDLIVRFTHQTRCQLIKLVFEKWIENKKVVLRILLTKNFYQ